MEHRYRIGEIVELKKQHPCGSKQWEITGGRWFQDKMSGLSASGDASRPKFEKSVKKIIRSLEEDL